ncbi:MAG: hypothetical protein ACJ79S_11890 [Gemmatimonadaceae bacterium]
MSPFFTNLARHLPSRSPLPSFAGEVTRLRRFVPPFRFASFFAPEDTLLCVVAAEAALARLTGAPGAGGGETRRIVELTAGSGLVGLRLLDLDPAATLLGVDADPGSPAVAGANAEHLALADRARFERASIWDAGLEGLLAATDADLLVCNPPCVPEPPTALMAAGAGRDGTVHLRRALSLAAAARPRALALCWSSLADPVDVVIDAERAGYRLESLYAVAIADGEHSGAVHRYLRTVPTAFLSEAPDVVALVAPDGAARFAYLLLAGVFVDRGARAPDAAPAWLVDRLVRGFVDQGADALVTPPASPVAVTAWSLDRWDEVALRAYLHGAIEPEAVVSGVALPNAAGALSGAAG